MTNFLFDLVSNLALLAIVRVACGICNRTVPRAALNGSYVFVALALTAILFDAALTFLVFADARTRYGQFSTSAAFFARSAAYGLAIIAAIAWRNVDRRKASTKVEADKPLVIQTSPYSESQLPM
jgi:hypothetical protein